MNKTWRGLEARQPEIKLTDSRKVLKPPRPIAVFEDWDDAEEEHRKVEQPAWPWWAFA